MIEEPQPIGIIVTTGYGAHTQQPYVQILIESADWMSQMDPATARDLAHNLLAAAEAIEALRKIKAFGDLHTEEPPEQVNLFPEHLPGYVDPPKEY